MSSCYPTYNRASQGGRAGEGDLQQALERVEAAKATREEFRRGLEDARSKYRRIIGAEAITFAFLVRSATSRG